MSPSATTTRKSNSSCFLPSNFLLFAKMAYNDDYQKGFAPELEFDIAGEVKLAGSFYSFETRDLRPADDSDDGDCLGSSLHTSWTRC